MNQEWWMLHAPYLDKQDAKANVTVCQNGVLSGLEYVVEAAQNLDLKIEKHFKDGDCVAAGQVVMRLNGKLTNLLLSERMLPGILSKPSGVATAARQAKNIAGDKIRIVVGALKKVTPGSRDIIYKALKAGGVETKLVDGPMIYLEKNIIRAFGGLKNVLEVAAGNAEKTIVVQIRGIYGSVIEEARLAIQYGASFLMIDTGNKTDLHSLLGSLTSKEIGCVRIAFSGEVQIDEIRDYANLGVDALCIGKAILDAPMLDFKVDIAIK